MGRAVFKGWLALLGVRRAHNLCGSHAIAVTVLLVNLNRGTTTAVLERRQRKAVTAAMQRLSVYQATSL